MKKYILLLASFGSILWASAQSISMNPKIAKAQGSSNNILLEAKSIFTNNSNDSAFEWNILEIQMTSGWEYGMCDPFNCLTNLAVGNKGIFTVGKGKTGEFKGDFVPNSIGGNGRALVQIYAIANPTIRDTVEFIINGWAVGLKEANVNREFTMYPNPVKDRLTIKYNARETVNIEIYNVLGTKVKSISHSSLESDVNVSDLQNGIYFIRYKNGNQMVSKPFTKSE
ncbi:MAG: T9SS type A sorting domain-containing protein [Bacteroidetes bacterium]|jgi:hypothetical protein|nr:T9SS type A sorting domain-containing protein [Bacteroidota bacterium]